MFDLFLVFFHFLKSDIVFCHTGRIMLQRCQAMKAFSLNNFQ